MSDNTTPRPWHRRIGREGNGSPRSQHEQICNEEDVGAIMLEHDGSPEGNANAALVVRAVNAHDALVEAVREADRILWMAGAYAELSKGRELRDYKEAAEAIRKGLALAEEKP